MDNADTNLQRIRLWDVPTRLFHWLLLLAVVTAVVSGMVGGDWMALHGMAGLLILGLLAFRLIWGFVGNRYARFVNFFPWPSRLLSYLHGRWHGLGHNPLGALSVFAMLALLSLQVGTGLFSNDEIAFTGPLFGIVSDALSLRLTGLHRLLSGVLLGMLGLHLAAVMFYTFVKKDNLIKPMLTGFKDRIDHQTDATEDAGEDADADAQPKSSGWIALGIALAVAAIAACLASGILLRKAPTQTLTPNSTQTSAPSQPAW